MGSSNTREPQNWGGGGLRGKEEAASDSIGQAGICRKATFSKASSCFRDLIFQGPKTPSVKGRAQ